MSLTERRQLQPLLDALHEALLSYDVIHIDEPPVQMLAPCMKKTHLRLGLPHRAVFCAQAVVYDFSPNRAGEHARTFWAPRAASWSATTSLAIR